MTHPFQRWPASHRRATLILAAGASVLFLVAAVVAQPLPAGSDIVDFELAGSAARTQEILDVWRAEDAIGTAKALQLADLVFPLVYAGALAGACLAASGAWRRAGRPRAAATGVALAWVAFAAAGFDYVENLGLAVSLWGDPATPWPQIAMVAAVAKFAAIAATLLYAAAGLVATYAPRYRA